MSGRLVASRSWSSRWRTWPVSFTERTVRKPLAEAVTRMIPQ